MIYDEIDGNEFITRDNLEVLRGLRKKSIDLVYIDPPFFTGKKRQTILDGAVFSYDDTFNNNMDEYLVWLRKRLLYIWSVLKPTGSFYCHLDHHAVHYVKVILDEIFGYKNFRNEIIWKRKNGSNSTGKARRWPNNSDYILYYTKSNSYTFNEQYIDDRDDLPNSIKKKYNKDDNDDKGLYFLGPMEAPSCSPTLKFKFRGINAPQKGWRWTNERMKKSYSDGILVIGKDKKNNKTKNLFKQ